MTARTTSDPDGVDAELIDAGLIDVELVDIDAVRGHVHRPSGTAVGAVALTHGAGGNSDAAILVRSAQEWAARGFVVLRFDLAFRRRKPSGPPHPSKADGDRASIESAVAYLREQNFGRLVVGGHSYGGRQASMVLAEKPDIADGLILLSYPLHPPGKPEKARTAHLPDLRTPTLFVHGTKDPFGTSEELADAAALVPAATSVVEIEGAGHDLSAAKHRVAERASDAALELFG